MWPIPPARRAYVCLSCILRSSKRSFTAASAKSIELNQHTSPSNPDSTILSGDLPPPQFGSTKPTAPENEATASDKVKPLGNDCREGDKKKRQHPKPKSQSGQHDLKTQDLQKPSHSGKRKNVAKKKDGNDNGDASCTPFTSMTLSEASQNISGLATKFAKGIPLDQSLKQLQESNGAFRTTQVEEPENDQGSGRTRGKSRRRSRRNHKAIARLRLRKINQNQPLIRKHEGEYGPIVRLIRLKGDQMRVATDKTTQPKRAATSGATSQKEKPAYSDPFAKLKPEDLETVRAIGLEIVPVEIETPAVPSLSHDLSRVLFNPGIYQLKDPRSRVYNFDPYLERIMPVAEFDYDALKNYITSSKDTNLSQIASERGRKYVGSSSSMTGTLAHFHFLLSQWRDINTTTVSRGFPEQLKSFTAIQRAPAAVFLRYNDGIYAIDADKEFDSATILMSLGRSMEKLLTLKTEDFERYRKSSTTKIPEEERTAPESYHYSQFGQFLMRSQLDAHDSRLPGSGMFDLKTRAVVSIRMNSTNHSEGLGYEIKNRFGEWESYEREFYDMIRSAFLKYSLQVRMGRMDGIFVAYHNVERIFGFQYVSLPELDLHLHGQSDTTLGDQEFKVSLELLNAVLERATQKYPGRSLRLHFETRETTTTPFMYIFAEPVDDEDIQAIQESNKEMIAAFQERVFNSERFAESQSEEPLNGQARFGRQETSDEVAASKVETEDSNPHLDNPRFHESPTTSTPEIPASAPLGGEADSTPTPSGSTVAHAATEPEVGSLGGADAPVHDEAGTTASEEASAELAETSSNTPPVKSVLGMVLTIRNKVNGRIVARPMNLKPAEAWEVDYTLTEINKGARAETQYEACKRRRKAELERVRETDTAASYYLTKIKEITERGTAWRREQDAMDAGKKIVRLYGEAQ